LFWSLVILVQYWTNNPKYGQAFELFQYGSLLVFLLALGGGITFLLRKFSKKFQNRINGLAVFGGLCLIDLIGLQFYYSIDESANKATASFGSHFIWFLGLVASLFLIYLLIRVLGTIFFQVFPVPIDKEDLSIVEAAVGSMLLATLLFSLGLLGGINIFILAPIFVLILVAHWKIVWQIIQKTFWHPLIKTKELNIIGIYSFLFAGCFIVFNFIQILRPFPAGTDSLNLYVNLPNLIAQSGELIAGYQPYNWSLIMALGGAVFGRIDVILGLSFLGGFLAFIAFYRLCRKRMSVNYAALCVLLFCSLPMVNFLTYMDMKIDMALTFVSLTILLLFYNLVSNLKHKTNKKNKKSPTGPKYIQALHKYFKTKLPALFLENRLLILIGLLTGFAFGIKLTILFFFLALIVAIWFVKGGSLAMWSAFFLSFAATFLLKLDAHPLLRNFHEGVNILQWLLLLIGVVLTTYFVAKNKKEGIHLLKITLLTGAFFVLPVLPWLVKNVVEAGKISVNSLANGKKKTPELNIKQIKKQLNNE
jgi:hypothetical protein